MPEITAGGQFIGKGDVQLPWIQTSKSRAEADRGAKARYTSHRICIREPRLMLSSSQGTEET